MSEGSSPLARGLRGWTHIIVVNRGIIPARAGFTPSHQRQTMRSPDHPRSRGVYIQTAVQTVVAWGSSPLARGLRLSEEVQSVIEGIIPARAGFTVEKVPDLILIGDHPRSRGVYLNRSPTRLNLAGSSPLARGLHSRPTPSCQATRIIPARAGFTAARSAELRYW